MKPSIDPAVNAMPGAAAMPRRNGELVFEAPWQGRAFGLALGLVQQLGLEWKDFQAHLIAEIAAHPDAPYYDSWVTAIERLAVERGCVSDAELERAGGTPLMILVAGPYRSGTNDDPVLIARNVAAMNDAALRLFRAGHLPVLGEWYALPLIEHAGSTGIGDSIFDEIFHPISRRLVAKCDGCLRIGGPSAGADEMVALARRHGKAVYFSFDEIL